MHSVRKIKRAIQTTNKRNIDVWSCKVSSNIACIHSKVKPALDISGDVEFWVLFHFVIRNDIDRRFIMSVLRMQRKTTFNILN